MKTMLTPATALVLTFAALPSRPARACEAHAKARAEAQAAPHAPAHGSGHPSSHASGHADKTAVNGTLVDLACAPGLPQAAARTCGATPSVPGVLTRGGEVVLLVAHPARHKAINGARRLMNRQVVANGKSVSTGGLRLLVVDELQGQ